MDFFERQWSSYRAVVEHDLMEHQAAATAVATALHHWLEQRPAEATAPALIDLGCGDLALLAPLLRRRLQHLPIWPSERSRVLLSWARIPAKWLFGLPVL